ncbi:uncharacterized protein CTHT_0032770 [Thermochaetoides thermophila DSM 1495]|uniref:Uncharacterized protein n=1 Tax=Chaetomium thermophilum (strain DSM 1495 / CBS 144.50 / IMI 039719) TaxID=759272 RepID=G0S5A0_CHATD|nr:hypothetical protein CTHT_0032770 [Thermochaetoides thermophila DSM 1495]EGS21419.1 hypothetical protein CTHT_0032770 [Thermochaetoides thermophila DSM 1495]
MSPTSNSPLPTPSGISKRAALTALRGLVVGTSCTLALIAEDRRRKINNAMRAVENGERIKNARAYHRAVIVNGGQQKRGISTSSRGGVVGGSNSSAAAIALALGVEEDALVEAGLVTAVPPMKILRVEKKDDKVEEPLPVGRKKKVGTSGRIGIEEEGEEAVLGKFGPGEGRAKEVAKVQRQQTQRTQTSTQHQQTQPQPIIPILKAKPPSFSVPSEVKRPQPIQPPSLNWLRSPSQLAKEFAFPSNDEIVAMVHESCASKDRQKVANAQRTVLEAMLENLAPDNQHQAWMKATALLCRTCQELGMIDKAATLLQHIINRGPIDEKVYMDHEPLTLIETLLSRTDPATVSRDVYLQSSLDPAVNLYLPTYTIRPSGPNPRVYEVGCRLMEAAFAAKRTHRIMGIYRRCNLIAGDDAERLTSWFLTKLYERHDYKDAVKLFLSTYALANPAEPRGIHAVGSVIVQCVENAHNYRPAEVLAVLQKVCAGPAKTKLNPKWVMKLMVARWRETQDFGKVEEMFDSLREPTLKDNVFNANSLYRVMIELALEAGNETKSEEYFLEGVQQNPALESDIRVQGIFARFYARDGDWAAVRTAFEAMRAKEKQPLTERDHRAYAEVFVPVLKAYAETHSIRETEQFVQEYLDDLAVPLCSYTVTLMAKHYAAVRDVDSLIAWLDRCSRAGFPIDAAFTNAILVRCRRQWNFPFRELRLLFRRLRQLNPALIDRHTEQVMAVAALQDARYVGWPVLRRLLSLKLERTRLPTRAKCVHAEDILLNMKEALSLGRPGTALRLYRRARHTSLPLSPQALRLAVRARFRLGGPAMWDGVFKLIKEADAKGEDVTSAINYVLAMRLGEVASASAMDGQEVYAVVERTLTQFQRYGVRLTEASLHRAALACLAAGHFQAAVGYALKAAEVRACPQTPDSLPPLNGGAQVTPTPCFNLQNFKILLAAYASLLDLPSLRDTIARALSSPYREHKAVRSALRHARLWAAQARGCPAPSDTLRRQAREMIDAGIRQIVEMRRKLRQEGKRFEREAMMILKRAIGEMGVAERGDRGVRLPWEERRLVNFVGKEDEGDEEDERSDDDDDDELEEEVVRVAGQQTTKGEDCFAELRREIEGHVKAPATVEAF